MAELRQLRKDDHHRLRGVEAAVSQMIDAQRSARDAESRQYRRMANAIQMGSVVMAAALVALGVITILTHTG